MARAPLSSQRGSRLRCILSREIYSYLEVLRLRLGPFKWDNISFEEGFRIPVRNLFEDYVRLPVGVDISGGTPDIDVLVFMSWQIWLYSHCRLAFTWIGDTLTDEPTSLSEHTLRHWHGLARLRHLIISVMTDSALTDARAFHTCFSPLGSTCRRHRASWKACWSKLGIAIRRLRSLRDSSPQRDWLAFDILKDHAEAHSEHWDFSPAFLHTPEISGVSLDCLAANLRKLIEDFRFVAKEETVDLIRFGLEEEPVQLLLSVAQGLKRK